MAQQHTVRQVPAATSRSFLRTPELTNTPVLGQATLEHLRAELRGQLILPDDPDYETARMLWNGMFDKRPALIV